MKQGPLLVLAPSHGYVVSWCGIWIIKATAAVSAKSFSLLPAEYSSKAGGYTPMKGMLGA